MAPGVADRAVEVRALTKSYGDLRAVRGIDLTVHRGEVFALLGPNGAGKTTTVEILEGYRRRDGGQVRVLGHDPGQERAKIKPLIGIVLQSTGVDRYLTVVETVAMYASYYPHPRPAAEVLELVGLTAKRNSRVIKLSGGQQRRLDMAVALAGDPDLLFLDEPTTAGFVVRKEDERTAGGCQPRLRLGDGHPGRGRRAHGHRRGQRSLPVGLRVHPPISRTPLAVLVRQGRSAWPSGPASPVPMQSLALCWKRGNAALEVDHGNRDHAYHDDPHPVRTHHRGLAVRPRRAAHRDGSCRPGHSLRTLRPVGGLGLADTR
jgi:predicted ABC-type transport system involved in lysophospholipase L1 biosynthesis ATPase subunit